VILNNGLSMSETLPASWDHDDQFCRRAVGEIVIVDPRCDRYSDFVEAAAEGEFGLHFCCDAQSAIKLARRFRADIWLVSSDLPDADGFDLLPLLCEQVSQAEVNPLVRGHRLSLARVGQGRHSGIFIVSEDYRLEEEQRALAVGIAGYLVQPVSADLIRSLRPAVPDHAGDEHVEAA
jgi:PleD family two-component response regulator